MNCRRVFAIAGLLLSAAVARAADETINVTITVDAAAQTTPLKPIWRWCGYDEPNYTYAPNGKKLIKALTEDNSPFGPAYFRCHSLLCTGDGTAHLKWGSTNAYTEDANGKPVYDWTIIDKIFDTYKDAGARPYAQIGFMPKALSLRPEPYEHHWKPGDPYGNIYLGWTTPPNDYDKWRELNFQWAKHCVERYGMEEVSKWYWEVWNECNIDYLSPSTPSQNPDRAQRGTENTATKTIDYQKIWDYAADGIRKAIPNAIIGGAETAGDGGKFQRDFIEHCINGTNFATGQKGSPLGLISFHAKGAPRNRNGHVLMGISNQLQTINAGFGIVAAREQTKPLPIVIGESDPDGCAACASANGLYPEYGYRNGSLFAAYTIEQLVRTMDLADQHQVNILGAVTWAFEFEDQPIFGGFRALATDGIELPVCHTFHMLNRMAPQRLPVKSTGDVGLEAIRRGGVRGENPDVHAIASRDARRMTIIAWNYHDEDVPGPAADVALDVENLPDGVKSVKRAEWRVDAEHSNAYTAWKAMGSPKTLSGPQRDELEAASKLATIDGPATVEVTGGTAHVKLNLPRQGVGLVELSW
jgi:xylan 1,4-beta-xylosidase